jgi:aromatic ring hydroxylase
MVNMASTKYEVKKLNGRNNFSLWQRGITDLLIEQEIYKALLWKAKKPQNMDDDGWEVMDAKAANAIDNVIDEEMAETI